MEKTYAFILKWLATCAVIAYVVGSLHASLQSVFSIPAPMSDAWCTSDPQSTVTENGVQVTCSDYVDEYHRVAYNFNQGRIELNGRLHYVAMFIGFLLLIGATYFFENYSEMAGSRLFGAAFCALFIVPAWGLVYYFFEVQYYVPPYAANSYDAKMIDTCIRLYRSAGGLFDGPLWESELTSYCKSLRGNR